MMRTGIYGQILCIVPRSPGPAALPAVQQPDSVSSLRCATFACAPVLIWRGRGVSSGGKILKIQFAGSRSVLNYRITALSNYRIILCFFVQVVFPLELKIAAEVEPADLLVFCQFFGGTVFEYLSLNEEIGTVTD